MTQPRSLPLALLDISLNAVSLEDPFGLERWIEEARKVSIKKGRHSPSTGAKKALEFPKSFSLWALSFAFFFFFSETPYNLVILPVPLSVKCCSKRTVLKICLHWDQQLA